MDDAKGPGRASPEKGGAARHRIGVLGLGEGRSILSAVLNSGRWELARACDLDEGLCARRAAEFGLRPGTTTGRYEDLLEDDGIEVVAIYTPDQLHAEHARMALEAGKHVICTKPLLSSLDQAGALIEAQSRSGKHLFVGQSTRFFEPMMRQRRDFLAGRHGSLQSVDAFYITDARWFQSRAWSARPGFSWMYNFLIHAVDLLRWYAPDIEEVMGYGKIGEAMAAGGSKVPDTLRFIARSAGGVVGQLAGSYAGPALGKEAESSIACTLRGETGASRASYPSLRYQTHFVPGEVESRVFEDAQEYYFRFERDSHHAGEYQNYIEYFAECLDSGETPKPDLAEGLGTLAVLEAMDRSLASGKSCATAEVAREYGLPPLSVEPGYRLSAAGVAPKARR
jgi:predicted dehydrogenase